MLPSHKDRQIVLIQANGTEDFDVHRFHHPISVLKKKSINLVHSLACRKGHHVTSNIYRESKESWAVPGSLDILDLERLDTHMSQYPYM